MEPPAAPPPRRRARARGRGAGRAALLALAALACASLPPTRFEDTWRAPDLASVSFEKVVAVVPSASEAVRRAGEDELVRLIRERGTEAHPSYALFPADVARDREHVREVLMRAGFDGAVVIRPLGSEQVARWVPGAAVAAPWYHRPWGYWGHAWDEVYAPGYLVTDRVVEAEILVYSLPRDALLWAGRSRTANPEGVAELVRSVAAATREVMAREGLLPR